MERDFVRLLEEAERQPFSGWEFSFVADRLISEDTSYRAISLPLALG